MSDHLVRVLTCGSGIQRDGTEFDSSAYIDGKHVRFYRGKPRKIGGYKLIIPGSGRIIRKILIDSTTDLPNNGVVTYQGKTDSITICTVNEEGVASVEIDITPTADFVGDYLNDWSLDAISLIVDTQPTNLFLALVCPDSDNINSTTFGNLFYGVVGSIDPLMPVTDLDSSELIMGSSFVCSVGSFIIIGGLAGFIRFNQDGLINKWPEAAIQQISNTKLVTCQETRGGGNPTALVWSLDSLIRISFQPSTLDWASDVISNDTSILSAASVVQVNSVFYWLGLQQPFIFNGVVQTLDNDMNKNFLYDNLNYNARTRVFGVHLPRFTEIWWGVPLFGSTEVNHFIIFNYRDNRWYDTPMSRSCGYYSSVFQYPIMASSIPEPDLTFLPSTPLVPLVYSVYMHDYGFDAVRYNVNYAIDSYFVTNYNSILDVMPEKDKQIRTRAVEPDFVQHEEMNLQVINRGYANSAPVFSEIYKFTQNTQKIDVNTQGRLVAYKFSSNINGGFYQMGVVRVQYQLGDERPGS